MIDKKMNGKKPTGGGRPLPPAIRVIRGASSYHAGEMGTTNDTNGALRPTHLLAIVTGVAAVEC